MRRAARVDDNLASIVKAARKMGFRIYVRNDVLADVDAQIGEVHEAWECKGIKGKFTDQQKRLRAEGWRIRTVRSVDDVMLARSQMMQAASAIQRARLG